MPRLLSTQSHVVHGYVGNKAATFPLQCRGWDVDCVNSVQLSCHTGYNQDNVRGHVVDEEELRVVFEGIERLIKGEPHVKYDALLSGYLPSKDSVSMVAQYYMSLKKQRPDLLWLLDPVMGDEGQLYVEENVIPEYRKLVRSGFVDAIVPNHYELELLSGGTISNLKEVLQTIDELHNHVKIIIVTSLSSAILDDKEHVYCVASVAGTEKQRVCFKVPIIDAHFTGTGDLFSALIIDSLHRFLSDKCADIKQTVNHVLNVIHKVLTVTIESYRQRELIGAGCNSESLGLELKLIECRDDFESEYDPVSLVDYTYELQGTGDLQ
ncbi:HDL147Cp [Eremothecium sinecaudum]|uniref:pyridoxal kinase n=1 Tax=Eremothecium sinecaudum TaxID=45286 RepID=A0A120K269_9SACH|nr:HDL147Cp [Eremothecium sinecaudum]AMD20597.1 HDL147Cp [Eremothecium sinecaudum]